MADNITAPGTGEVLAYDDLGAVKIERVKMCAGPDGSASDVELGQQSMADSLPVTLASDQSQVPTTDDGPAWTSNYKFTTSADATGGADITNAPSAGQRIYVTDILISVDTAMYVSFLEETSGTEVMRLYLPANGSAQITPRSAFRLPTADRKLRIDASVAGNIAVTCWYYSEADEA